MEKKAGINGKAVVSVVLGGLSFITPLIGFVLGIIGVLTSRVASKEIVKTNMNGIGIATFGLIFSIAGILHQISSMFNLVAVFKS